MSVPSDSENEEEWIESGSSMHDVSLPHDDESHTSDEGEVENTNKFVTVEETENEEENGKKSYKKVILS